ncbi:E3 ubiquitin-protein ligase TRIM56-like [Saccostrea cucullata]|uniref:E3 ubiquitin-protein ligase TRIM56-like n=1 Tax=Saccostrea cuccullata TaxID=36930 RepID=UPI002ED49C62
MCRESFSIKLEEIKTNFCLVNMIELIKNSTGSSEFCSFCLLMEEKRPAVSQCLTCLDYLCNECGKMRHAFTRQTRDHKVVSMKDIKTGKFEKEIRLAQKERCSKHADEILAFFCMSCQLPVCRDCLIYEHREHKFKPISELRKAKELEINEVINPLKKKLKDFQDCSASITVELKDCEAKENKILQEISKSCLEAINCIKTSQRNIEKEIQNQMHLHKENLQHAFDNISKHCKSIEESITFSNNILMDGNDFEVLQLMDEIYERVLSLNGLNCTEMCLSKNKELPEYKITWKEPKLLSFSLKTSGAKTSSIQTEEKDYAYVEPVIDECREEKEENDKITDLPSSEHICCLFPRARFEPLSASAPYLPPSIKIAKQCVLSFVRTLKFNVSDDQCTPVHSSVTWTRDGRVVAIDKMSEKMLSITLSTEVKKSIKIPKILSVSANAAGFVCKTSDGYLLKLDRQFAEIGRYEGVSTIVSTSPNNRLTI